MERARIPREKARNAGQAEAYGAHFLDALRAEVKRLERQASETDPHTQSVADRWLARRTDKCGSVSAARMVHVTMDRNGGDR